ncbi:hypothetical protein YC2023_008455 [Brassica napus]
MAKGRATRDMIRDESHPRAMKKEHRSQITKNQILKTKTSKDYRWQTSDEENNINDN